MGKQATQKETIEYIREEDFMNNSLSAEERKRIKDLHREVKKFLKNKKEVIQAAKKFKEYTINECSSGTYDYYADVINYLTNNPGISMIFGYHNYRLNTPSLFRWLEKILEVKKCIVNY
ncbi:MAG: hypothetical protein ACOCP8_06270 [archaeon]